MTIHSEFTSRLAVIDDVPALTVLMDAAIAELQRDFLDAAQIASSRAIMGIDTQLIDDGTYFVVESVGEHRRLWWLESPRDALRRQPDAGS